MVHSCIPQNIFLVLAAAFVLKGALLIKLDLTRVRGGVVKGKHVIEDFGQHTNKKNNN